MVAGLCLLLAAASARGEPLTVFSFDRSARTTPFYRPELMPKEGDPVPPGLDVAGGLEQVAGVTSGGRPIRNWRPGWVLLDSFARVPDIADQEMKFYRSPRVDGEPTGDAPTLLALLTVAAEPEFRRCRTPLCRGVVTIARVVEAVDDAQGAELLIAPGFVDAGRTAGEERRRIDALLLHRRSLFEAVCGAALGMMKATHLAAEPDVRETAVTLLVTAVDMDVAAEGNCAAALLQALPPEAGNAPLRVDAHTLCENGGLGRRRAAGACDELAPPGGG